MVVPSKIIAALKGTFAAACPECTIYQDEVPQDFDRPSLYVALLSASRGPITRGTMQNTERYAVYCFTPTDDYGYSDAAELMALQERVVQALDAGYIPVDDRAVTLTAVSAQQPQADYAVVNIDAIYVEARQEQKKEYDLMQVVNTKIAGGVKG